jgi:hypothetical protein
MSESRGVTGVEIFTAALFAGSNLVILIAGGVLGVALWNFSWLPTICWGGGFVAYLAKVVGTTQDRAFIAQLNKEHAELFSDRQDPRVLAAGADLSGKYLEGYKRVKLLSEGLTSQIKQLPEGPGKDAFLEFLPKVQGVTSEVHQLALQMQKTEKTVSGGAAERLQKEIQDLEAQVAASSDPEVRSQLGLAVQKKKEAVAHYENAGSGIARIGSQIEAIAAALQEAQARVVALGGNLQDPVRIAPAREAVEDISREVKYLTQTVEETTRLLQ